MKKNNRQLSLISKSFDVHINLAKKTSSDLIEKIKLASDYLVKILKKGNTIFIAGNGGSAADSQHIVAELVGRFKKKRKPLKSIALTTNTSNLTAIGNDFGYEHVFSRQLKALGNAGDALISISTSGKIEEGTEEELKQAITDFNKTFIKTKEAVTNENN